MPGSPVAGIAAAVVVSVLWSTMAFGQAAGTVQASPPEGTIVPPVTGTNRVDTGADSAAAEDSELVVQPFDATFAFFRHMCLEPAGMREPFTVPAWQEQEIPGVAPDRQNALVTRRAWAMTEAGTTFAIVHATETGATRSVHRSARVRTCQVTAFQAPDPVFVQVQLRKSLRSPPAGRLSGKDDDWWFDVWTTVRERGQNTLDFRKFPGVVIEDPRFYSMGRQYVVVEFYRGIRKEGVHSIRMVIYSRD